MNAVTDLSLQRYNHLGSQKLKGELLSIYEEVYVDRLGEPFFHPARFWERLEFYASNEGFRLVTGQVERELVGLALGSALSSKTAWWRGLKSEVSPEFLRETGARTFAIRELMVRTAWRRRGYAKVLSDALLEGLQVERATLLVRADNVAAYAAYKSWNFHAIGQVQPFEDSPVYEAMVKNLRL